MSWKDNLEFIPFEIITGDKKKWNPLWKDFKKTLKYNVEGFDFNNVEGTFVGRKKKSGNQYPLTFYFQGENCLQEAEDFERSSRDSRSWTITHPFMGKIKAQPLNFLFDYSLYNTVKITGVVWETIAKGFPQLLRDVKSDVGLLKDDIDGLTVELAGKSSIKVTSNNIFPANSAVNEFSSKYKLIIPDNSKAQALKNLTRSAFDAAENIGSDYVNYINQVTALINFPFQLVGNLKSKLESIREALLRLPFDFDPDNDKDSEAYSFLSMSSVGLTAVASFDDIEYDTIEDALLTIDTISEIYESVLLELDARPFVPDPDLLILADLIINTALSGLFELAFDAKQKRTTLIPHDSNAILLAHKYYGPSDDNLDQFINKNNLSMDELVQIKKGRKIVYFV